ncbi:MAG: hypothetical protein ACR2OR_05405 [Hyphomicrobiales bacterium]
MSDAKRRCEFRKNFISSMKESDRNLANTEAAEYIAEMAAGLREIAKQANMEFLAYLLDMVYHEAFDKNSSAAGGHKQGGN